MVKWRRCWLASRGACGAGGAPAPGSGATTPFPEAGVRKRPAPEGALRLKQDTDTVLIMLGQKAPSTRRCIKTWTGLTGLHEVPLSESTQHQKAY